MEVDEFLDLGFGGWVVVFEALLEGEAAEQLPNCMGVSYCYRGFGTGYVVINFAIHTSLLLHISRFQAFI
jgi:hypothetical protein